MINAGNMNITIYQAKENRADKLGPTYHVISLQQPRTHSAK